MKKYFIDKNIDNEWLYLEFKRHDDRARIDMRKNYICMKNDKDKILRFLMNKIDLISCLMKRILWFVIICILIDPKWTCSSHVHRLYCSLSLRLHMIDFDVKVNVELAMNRDHFCGICASIHDFEAVHRCMWECEHRVVLFAHSFAHYASRRTQRREFVDVGVGRFWNFLVQNETFNSLILGFLNP